MRSTRLAELSRRWTVAYWLTAIGVAGGWWVLSTSLIPGYISEAYGGGGPALLSRTIAGIGSRPLDVWLETWRQTAATATIWLLGGILVLYFILHVIHTVRSSARA